jgi:hypothetical protein
MRIFLVFPIIFYLFMISGLSYAKISEKDLDRINNSIILRTMEDSGEDEDVIKKYLFCVLKEAGSRSRLIDKIGLFLCESEKNEIILIKAFLSRTSSNYFSVFMVMKDKKDGQLYAFTAEFEINAKMKECRFRDAYFSIVFDERMKEVRRYFEGK